jgi:hypothetical protein
MALTIHSLILNDIMADLGELSVSNGDTFTPRAVFDYMPNEQSVKNDRVQPAIWVWAGTEQRSLQEFIEGVYVEMPVNIGFLMRVGNTGAQQAGVEMAADIYRKIFSTNPRIIGGSTVELAPLSMTVLPGELDQGQAGGHMDIVAKFTHTLGDPSVAF